MATKRSIVLVPVDFSEASAEAVSAAKGFASALDADLTLLHVCDPPAWAYPEVPAELVQRIYEEARIAARQSLDDFAAEHGGLQAIMREGDPAHRILEVIAEMAPQMVVMGTHGRRGVARFFIGSVTEQVIRKSPVPVLSVRAREAITAGAAARARRAG